VGLGQDRTVTRLGVDVGGTFTDLVAVGRDGALEIRKVLSTPHDPAEGMFRAVDALGLEAAGAIDVLVHGTTIATNALLERRGARTALVITTGFEDLLWLRRQDRASLYDLALDHPPPLVSDEHVIGMAERMGPDGVVRPLEAGEINRVVAAVRACAPQAVAVVGVFAFRHPQHEHAMAQALRAALPGVPVVASHDVLPVFREFERCSTTVAEAYLRPLVSDYVTRAAREAHGRGIAGLRVMASGGGTLAAEAAAVNAAALALSGPVGGVVGARLLGDAVGLGDLLTLDMGGTSADASLVLSGVARQEGAAVVGGVPIALPAVLIETVSAGGGSVAWVDDAGTLKVGPRSAGAVPGPAAYGRGGTEPTVTDACLALGWLDPAFTLAETVRLDRDLSLQAIHRLAAELGVSDTRAADGVVEVATAVMARALKRVSVARGVDPRELTLVPFGGAGPLFGCALADALGMSTVLIPAHPGVLSALGLAVAAERVELVASFHAEIQGLTPAAWAAACADLEATAATALPGAIVHQLADCRCVGQGYEITVPVDGGGLGAVEHRFRSLHESRYGHRGVGPVELVNVRVVAERMAPRPAFGKATRHREARTTPGSRRITVRGRTVRAAVWPLGELPGRLRIDGPAILAGHDATALIEPGWRGTAQDSGAIVLERQ
jgi:N-methylhydantoinase A